MLSTPSKTTSLTLLLLYLVFLVSCDNPNRDSKSDTRFSKIDSAFSAVNDFSGVVLIADKGKTVYHKAFGFKNFQTLEKLDTNSILELASVSKQFTAMIIMMLREEGKLSYEDKVEKYIQNFPYEGITIRHLLHHTSGLPDYQAIMDEYWDKNKVAGNDENIEYLTRYRPPAIFKPGDKYEYSNTGYMLLASIAEKSSGRDFIALCRDRIFRPLGMNQTDIRTKEEKLKLENIAWGHLYVSEKQRYIHADSFPEFNYTIWLGDRKGPGRISSTSSDLLKWDQALYSEKLVTSETLQEAFIPARLNNDSLSFYGFGWMIDQLSPDRNVVFHTGDNPGYETIIVRYLDVNKTVILLCNNAHPEFGAIIKTITSTVTY